MSLSKLSGQLWTEIRLCLNFKLTFSTKVTRCLGSSTRRTNWLACARKSPASTRTTAPATAEAPIRRAKSKTAGATLMKCSNCRESSVSEGKIPIVYSLIEYSRSVTKRQLWCLVGDWMGLFDKNESKMPVDYSRSRSWSKIWTIVAECQHSFIQILRFRLRSLDLRRGHLRPDRQPPRPRRRKDHPRGESLPRDRTRQPLPHPHQVRTDIGLAAMQGAMTWKIINLKDYT